MMVSQSKWNRQDPRTADAEDYPCHSYQLSLGIVQQMSKHALLLAVELADDAVRGPQDRRVRGTCE